MNATKRTVAAMSSGLLAVGLLAGPALADEHDEVAVNVTFLCQAPEDGEALAFGGATSQEVEVEEGDYIWRVGDERDGDLWSDGLESVGYSFLIDTNQFGAGDIGPGEVEFQVHSTGGSASVLVEEQYTNLKGGTATSGPATCEMVANEPDPDPTPAPKNECKDGGWEEQGFRNQGLCIASMQANGNAQVHG